MLQKELFQRMRSLLEDYERVLGAMDHRRPIMPRGSLSEAAHEDYHYYFRDLMESGRKMQIPIQANTRAGAHLINSLQMKRLLYHGTPLLRNNIRALKTALKHLAPYEPDALIHSSFRTNLPEDLLLPGQLDVGRWIDDTKAGNYRINPYKPEKRRIPTADGHMTRSKSEELWCDILFAESLLYRYECGLRLASGRTVYPDFTILHPRERQLVLIEHFGRMDDPGYAIDQLYKLEDYAASGWMPGRDLFFTVETKDRPLTRDRIYEVLYRNGLLPAAI